MKRLPTHLHFLILFVALLVVSCSPAIQEIKPDNSSSGLLWKISKPGFSDSYLFGTIHSDDERVAVLPPVIQTIFDQTPTFAMELILNDEASKIVMAHMYFSDGNSLESIVGESLYAKTLEILAKKGMPEQVVNQMKPWAVFTLLNMPDNQSGTFLDAILYQQALDAHKKVIGLETPLEQVSVFDGLDYKTQTKFLEITLDQINDMQKVMDEIIDVYLSRDLKQILAINEKYNHLMGEELSAIFNKRLLIDRNHRMSQRMLPLMKEGSLFTGVGALHLPGEEGIIKLLESEGFTLEPVY